MIMTQTLKTLLCAAVMGACAMAGGAAQAQSLKAQMAHVSHRTLAAYSACLAEPVMDGNALDCIAYLRTAEGTHRDKVSASNVHRQPARPESNYFGEGCESGCFLALR